MIRRSDKKGKNEEKLRHRFKCIARAIAITAISCTFLHSPDLSRVTCIRMQTSSGMRKEGAGEKMKCKQARVNFWTCRRGRMFAVSAPPADLCAVARARSSAEVEGFCGGESEGAVIAHGGRYSDD